jgi:hypothetical protein
LRDSLGLIDRTFRSIDRSEDRLNFIHGLSQIDRDAIGARFFHARD